jgi:hypothetical protein
VKNFFPLSGFDITNISLGTIILYNNYDNDHEDFEDRNPFTIFLLMISALERKLKMINFYSYLSSTNQVLFERNENEKAIPLVKPPSKIRPKSPSSVRVIRNTSLINDDNSGPVEESSKIGRRSLPVHKKKEGIAARDDDELDFFQIRLPDNDEEETGGEEDEEESSSQNDKSPSKTKRRNLLAVYSLDSSSSSPSKLPSKTTLKGNWEQPLKNSKGQLVNQPVTFHSRIKSSGYGQKSNDPFQRKLDAKRLQQQKQQKEKNLRSASAPRLRNEKNGKSDLIERNPNRGPRLRLYPIDCDVTTTHQSHWDYPDNNSTPAGKQLLFVACLVLTFL